MYKAIVSIFVFLVGACWGSFLNCLIYRWEQGKKVNRGRSFCPKCHHQLGFWDLIPVFSFIFLKRKCRYCKKPIAWQYLAVEIATGGLFLISYFLFLIHFLFLIYCWMIFSFLIIIFVYDLKRYIIPDRAVYPAIGLVFVFRILNLFGIWDLGFGISRPLVNWFFAGLGAAFFFFLIWLLSKGRAMGFGDVQLAFLMGIFLGFPNVLVALFSAFLIGSATGLILITLKKKKLKSQVPFGPFLVAGTFIGLFWGEKIIQWYLNLLG